MDEAATTRERLAAQGLLEPAARAPEAVVRRVLAVQAQDLRGAKLAIRSRSAGLSAGDVDRAFDERRLVVSWLNRGTLHLVTAEDHPWLWALTAPRLTAWNQRRLREEGVDEGEARRGVEILAAAVREHGPQTRMDIRARLEAANVRTVGQAYYHVLMAAAIGGHVVRGPMKDGEHAFVDAATWVGSPPDVDRDEALARLARRYLDGHGPADAADLAKWTGLTLGDARRALAAIASEVEPVGTEGLVRLAGRTATRATPTPRLLGAFDPILHGWSSREPLLGDHVGVVTANGVFRPTILVGGRVIGTWRLGRGRVELRFFDDPPPPPIAEALDAEAEDVLRFLGLPARAPLVATG